MTLTDEGRRLVDFARGARLTPSGFGWLDQAGRPDPTRPLHTWINARMTYVFSLAHQLGADGADGLAGHGVAALLGPLRDREHGGWLNAVEVGGTPADDRKDAYQHAFVALAAGTAAAAGVDGADDLLDRAAQVLRARFLDADGRVVEGYDRTFTTTEDYRGANASMHMVEALLVLGDVTTDRAWHRLALGIAEHLIHDVARRHDYLLPEHFTPDWVPLPDYHHDRPADPFRPYGATPGHLLEWSRLLLHLEASVAEPPAWLLTDAVALFDTAVRVGWSVDGAPGFVYTVDWDGCPVVRTRMHWVLAEGIAAAGALARRTAEPGYTGWRETWWEYAEHHLVDHVHGSWHHELDPSNRPASAVWQGKPDVYHAFQATLLPQLALAPAAAVQLARR